MNYKETNQLYNQDLTVLLFGFTKDLLYPPQCISEVATQLKKVNKDIKYYEVQTVFGHDGFLVEFEKWASPIKSAIELEYREDVHACLPLMLHF